jgi:hypothetical protein
MLVPSTRTSLPLPQLVDLFHFPLHSFHATNDVLVHVQCSQCSRLWDRIGSHHLSPFPGGMHNQPLYIAHYPLGSRTRARSVSKWVHVDASKSIDEGGPVDVAELW